MSGGHQGRVFAGIELKAVDHCGQEVATRRRDPEALPTARLQAGDAVGRASSAALPSVGRAASSGPFAALPDGERGGHLCAAETRADGDRLLTQAVTRRWGGDCR